MGLTSDKSGKVEVLTVLREAYTRAWTQQVAGEDAEQGFATARQLASGAAAHGATMPEIVRTLREGAIAAEEATGREIVFALR